MEQGQKKPIVIELTTSLATGFTSVVGASSVPCPVCRSQNTEYKDGEVECKEPQCPSQKKT